MLFIAAKKAAPLNIHNQVALPERLRGHPAKVVRKRA